MGALEQRSGAISCVLRFEAAVSCPRVDEGVEHPELSHAAGANIEWND